MLFTYKDCDCLPLVIDNEFDINNEDHLAEFVGKIILGHYAHVKRIIKTLATLDLNIIDDEIDAAISKLNSTSKEKRDGWIFQIISILPGCQELLSLRILNFKLPLTLPACQQV